MEVIIQDTPAAMGFSAAKKAAGLILGAISTKGTASIIIATGTSQFETLKQLIAEKEIDWSRVILFHLDEYIGIPDTHPASFRKYIKERFLEKLPPLKSVYLIPGEDAPEETCERMSAIIRQHPVDVALIGIGENGHLAFNDPPADFDTEKPFLVVQLDEACRRQQMNEGWFPTLSDVPLQAISMSVRQIMLSAHIICSVPDLRKAAAVRDCMEKEVSNLFPATILKTHKSCFLFLDKPAATLVANTV